MWDTAYPVHPEICLGKKKADCLENVLYVGNSFGHPNSTKLIRDHQGMRVSISLEDTFQLKLNDCDK